MYPYRTESDSTIFRFNHSFHSSTPSKPSVRALSSLSRHSGDIKTLWQQTARQIPIYRKMPTYWTRKVDHKQAKTTVRCFVALLALIFLAPHFTSCSVLLLVLLHFALYETSFRFTAILVEKFRCQAVLLRQAVMLSQ